MIGLHSVFFTPGVLVLVRISEMIDLNWMRVLRLPESRVLWRGAAKRTAELEIRDMNLVSSFSLKMHHESLSSSTHHHPTSSRNYGRPSRLSALPDQVLGTN